MSFRKCVALAVLLAAGITGCDFQAAEDAFDNFDVIIELEPINTVVNGIVVDNASGELIAATLEFSGPGASVLVDAYSDPINELDAEDGVVTFGIQNAVVPSESSPVSLTVTAIADGYFTTSESFEITATGDIQFTVALTSSNIAASVTGTASTQNSNTNTDSGGAVTQTVTVQTQQNAQTTASATVTVPQGSVPLTAAGTPLTGQITTQLRSYDSGSGLQALPTAARQRADGTNQAVAGAVFFKMQDASGNVAVGAQASSSGSAAAKSNGICTGGIQITLNSSDTDLRATYDLLTGLGIVVDASVYAYTPADGQNNLVASTLVEPDGTGLKVDLCLGGAAGSTGVVNTSAIGDASQGIIYTFAFASTLTSTGTLDNQVTIGGVSGTSNVRFTLAGPGINRTATVAVSNGPYALKTLVGAGGVTFSVVNNATYSLSARYPGSSQSVSVSVPAPLDGTSSITLPASSDLQTYSITASMQCADPDTQKFEVQITSQSLDAVSAFYRVAGSGDAWTVLSGGAITSKTATKSRIEIQGTLALRPNTPYRFKGVLGNDSSDTVETTPASGGSWTITLSTDDVGLSCVAK